MVRQAEDYRENVVTIGGTRALLALRLCNFETSRSYLLREHMSALDHRVRPLLHSLKGSWVDLIGYASHRGSEGSNQSLSEQRCRKVQDYLAVLDDVKFQIVQGLGESRSGPDGESDNSGWWRAVEVYVYGTKPRPDAPDVDVSTEFRIRILGGASGGLFGSNFDDYTFEIVDTRRNVGATFLYLGAGLAVPNPLPSLPVSQTKAGPFTPFRTSAPVRLRDFDGAAQLYQDYGVTVGSWTPEDWGTLRLSIESNRVIEAGARMIPSLIPIQGGWGLQSPSTGSVSAGTLRMQGVPTPR